MKKLLIFLFFLLCSMGCMASVAVGPIVSGVMMWKNGEAIKYYEIDGVILQRAVVRTLKDDFKLSITKNTSENNQFLITAKNKDKVEVKIIKNKRNFTEVRVRVNLLGDEPYSELFFTKLEKQIYTIAFDKTGKPCRLNHGQKKH